MPKRWYEFAAYNEQKLYGFGTAEEADRYEDALNIIRSMNHYHARICDDETTRRLASGATDGFVLWDELSELLDDPR